ncbi:MAG: 50S ribosomal protein L23 [Anaerolineae bacterium]|jgi:large subunit ribosomal protein L23|nr:50S ribosomal protein L23 [Anaerolineae bacterium]
MNLYQVLKRPVLTEKTDFQRDDNKYVFEVDRKANKLQIKEAIEVIFDVRVESVNTMIMKPKRRRMGRKLIVTRPAWKRAVVTLAPGERIQEFFEGV